MKKEIDIDMTITKARLITLIVLLTILCLPASAQKLPDLPADHPDVYYSFFFFVENFGQWLDARAKQAPQKQDKLLASAARYLKVDVKELPTLISTCQSVAANLRQISSDAAVAAGRSKAPDPGIAQSFEAQRQAAIQSGIAQMQHAVSAASWSGIYAHINGTHRAMLHLGVK